MSYNKDFLPVGVAANSVAAVGATIIAATFIQVDFGAVHYNDNCTVVTGANWSVTVPLTTKYRLSAKAGVVNQTGFTTWNNVTLAPAGAIELYPFINGVAQAQIGYWHNTTTSNDTQIQSVHHIAIGGTAVYSLTAGDIIDVRLFVNGFVNSGVSVLQSRGFGFQIERIMG